MSENTSTADECLSQYHAQLGDQKATDELYTKWAATYDKVSRYISNHIYTSPTTNRFVFSCV